MCEKLPGQVYAGPEVAYVVRIYHLLSPSCAYNSTFIATRFMQLYLLPLLRLFTLDQDDADRFTIPLLRDMPSLKFVKQGFHHVLARLKGTLPLRSHKMYDVFIGEFCDAVFMVDTNGTFHFICGNQLLYHSQVISLCY